MNSQLEKSFPSPAIVTGLFISLVLTTIFWWPGITDHLFPENLVWRNVFAQLADWAFCLVLIIIVLFWEKKPLASLGFKPLTNDNLFAGLGLGGFTMLLIAVWTLLRHYLFPESNNLSSGASGSEFPKHFFYWFAPFSLITASFCEEVIYRGYAMERLFKLTDQAWIIILLPHLAFSLMHLKDGCDHALMVAVAGILFSLYYYRYRDLTMVIIAHFFIDLLAIIGRVVGVG